MNTMNAVREFLWEEETEEEPCACGITARLTGRHSCGRENRKTGEREDFLPHVSWMTLAGAHGMS
jgi:hypothetical protein